jgi:hypothetical protein
LQTLKRYLRKDISKEFIVNPAGEALHSDCISHCLLYAFGECNHLHSNICNGCNFFFELFNNIQNNVSVDLQSIIEEYQKKLIYFMGHHARKTYLNAQLKANLAKLNHEEALFIVDYKMKILPKNARETKSEFYGKRGWTLHSVLVYTKEIGNDKLKIDAYNHWSDDTKQDAWFTASSLHAVLEVINPKPKRITIMSDNGPHYHNTELMIILSKWKEWYDVSVNKWIFLEAGEAKTPIDSHHATVNILFVFSFFCIPC